MNCIFPHPDPLPSDGRGKMCACCLNVRMLPALRTRLGFRRENMEASPILGHANLLVTSATSPSLPSDGRGKRCACCQNVRVLPALRTRLGFRRENMDASPILGHANLLVTSATSPSPIGWERVGVRAGCTREFHPRPHSNVIVRSYCQQGDSKYSAARTPAAAPVARQQPITRALAMASTSALMVLPAMNRFVTFAARKHSGGIS